MNIVHARVLSASAISMAATLALAGCGQVTGVTAPGPSAEIHMLESHAAIENDAVVVRVVLDRPVPIGDRGFRLQIEYDTDESDATGYGRLGSEYIARLVESRDGVRFPVRLTGGAPAVEAGSGGWGAVTGLGCSAPESRRVTVSVPLAALGHDDGKLRYAVWLIDANGRLNDETIGDRDRAHSTPPLFGNVASR